MQEGLDEKTDVEFCCTQLSFLV